MSAKILIIDDEPRIVRGVQRYFEQAGFQTVVAFDGVTGLDRARSEKPDLVILDLMLPGMDGLDVCRVLRRESNVPIIMLTARVEETDQLIGLELGADDYVTKPFSPRMLVARARAVLRRAQAIETPAGSESYHFSNVVFDVKARHCLVGGKKITLTPTEFEMLYALARHRGQALSRMQLLEATSLGVYEGAERTVDVHIHNLRRKLEADSANPSLIQTVFGVGYRLSEEI
ncbi:MAG: response regulator transcription factor [Anaerolineae bacterium]|nr:response regulator transcription factor [Anaerolineae bacterium]